MRVLTAGESHGPQLTAIIEGVPAGLYITAEEINEALSSRQKGYGRGGRMTIETDQVEIVGGLRYGRTLGGPLALVVKNRDWKNWQDIMSPWDLENVDKSKRAVTRPRPGHADLVGGMKYRHRDLRNILERSSARETAIRVAVGAVMEILLRQLDIELAAHVVNIGGVSIQQNTYVSIQEIRERISDSVVVCICPEASKKMVEKIDIAKREGDTVGGIVEVIVENMPPGIGSYVHYDRKLDGKLAQAIVSIQAFKGVEFGEGFQIVEKFGSQIHDEIYYNHEVGFSRYTNHYGGLEGGMSNGQPIIVRGVMKPIPTLYKPLRSVDIDTKEAFEATVERSDACAVPAASIIAKSVVAFELADAIIEQFGCDHMDRLKDVVAQYREEMRNY